jgi:hypothetical protein
MDEVHIAAPQSHRAPGRILNRGNGQNRDVLHRPDPDDRNRLRGYGRAKTMAIYRGSLKLVGPGEGQLLGESEVDEIIDDVPVRSPPKDST